MDRLFLASVMAKCLSVDFCLFTYLEHNSMTTSEPFQLISINSRGGRIGRLGWSNQKAWGGRGSRMVGP